MCRTGRSSPRESSVEHVAWEVEAHHPVRNVDEFGDSQIACDRAEHIGIVGAEPVQLPEQLDHIADGVARSSHEIRSDTGRHFIALCVEVSRYRPWCREAR